MSVDFSVFFKTPFPANKPIVIGDSIEASDVSLFFSERRFGDISLAELESDYAHDPAACLAFMTPEAFSFFLPSFMRIALEDYENANVIPEVVIRYLYAISDGTDMERRSAIQAFYSKEQLKAVTQFLQEMSARYWYRYPSDDAQAALALFWNQFEG